MPTVYTLQMLGLERVDFAKVHGSQVMSLHSDPRPFVAVESISGYGSHIER